MGASWREVRNLADPPARLSKKLVDLLARKDVANPVLRMMPIPRKAVHKKALSVGKFRSG